MISYISNVEIDELGEGLVREYLRKEYLQRSYVNIEGFITRYLGLNIEYANIAEEDKDKIGFISDGRMPIQIHNGRSIVRVIYPKGTIVLDNYLKNESERNRRRFTMAHEVGHYLLEHINPLQSIGAFCQSYDSERSYTVEEFAERLSLNEIQADRMAAALLMPKSLVEKVYRQYMGNRSITVYGEAVLSSSDKEMMRKMAQALRVSYTALLIRLRNLRMFEYRPLSEYINRELRLGGKVDGQ